MTDERIANVELEVASPEDAADLVRTLHPRGFTGAVVRLEYGWAVRLTAETDSAEHLVAELAGAVCEWLRDRGLLSVVASVAGERRILWPRVRRDRGDAPRREGRRPARELPPIEFRVSSRELEPHRTLVIVEGQADLYTAPLLRRELRRAIEDGTTEIVVDLSEATFVDSMTIGVLLQAVRRLHALGGWMQLVCPDRQIRRIFEVTLLDRIFSIHASTEEALGHVTRGG